MTASNQKPPCYATRQPTGRTDLPNLRQILQVSEYLVNLRLAVAASYDRRYRSVTHYQFQKLASTAIFPALTSQR